MFAQPPTGLTAWVVTAHAAFQMRRRGISRDVLQTVLAHPEQRHLDRPGREVFQRCVRVAFAPGPGADRLVRAFVDVDRSPAEVVTVYQTSKIDKYWRAAP